MFIDNSKIYYVSWQSYRDINCLADCFKVLSMSTTIPDGTNYNSWKNKIHETDCCFLGSKKQLENTIKSSYTPWNNFSTVYIEKDVVYPRYKLSNTNIKRKLSPTQADVVVINEPHLPNLYIYKLGTEIPHTLLYSESLDRYYFISFYPNSHYNRKMYNDFEQWTSIFNQNDLRQKLIDILITTEHFPSDVTIYYEGDVYFTSNSIKDIVSYSKTTYVKDLDAVVNQSLPQMTDDDFAQIEGMLSSNDDSINELAIKLLSNYDISKYKLRVVMLLNKNMGNLRWTKAKTSVGFKALCRILNYQPSSYGNNDLYSVILDTIDTGNIDASDLNYVKDFVIYEVQCRLGEVLGRRSAIIDAVNLKVSINFE